MGFLMGWVYQLRQELRRIALCPSETTGQLDGSSTICAKITARAAANGRRAHHRCNVLGCPCRIDFSRAEALLMASSGRATSISFLPCVIAASFGAVPCA